MMKGRRIALILVATLALLTFAVYVASGSDDSIIVNGADVILTPPVGNAPPVTVDTRVVVAYSNEVRRMDLEVIRVAPQISVRVVVENANAVLREGLEAVPVALPVPERVVVENANAIMQAALYYPREVISDTTPPELGAIAPLVGGSSTISITWTTDEFADSEVHYGDSPGLYTHVVTDALYVKQHEIGLTGLTAGVTFCYFVRSTDRSGNLAESLQNCFTPALYIYLPIVMRNSP
jgi:hypothetical protein